MDPSGTGTGDRFWVLGSCETVVVADRSLSSQSRQAHHAASQPEAEQAGRGPPGRWDPGRAFRRRHSELRVRAGRRQLRASPEATENLALVQAETVWPRGSWGAAERDKVRHAGQQGAARQRPAWGGVGLFVWSKRRS